LVLGFLLGVTVVGGSPLAPQGAAAVVPGGNGKIAFTRFGPGFDEVHAMNPDGSGQTNLTNNPASDSGPAWSPDGSRIAFHTDRDGNNEV
jgi:Tol biopolymer transport system component